MKSFVVLLFLFFAAIAVDVTGVWGHCAAVCGQTTAEINNINNNGDGVSCIVKENSNIFLLKKDLPNDEEIVLTKETGDRQSDGQQPLSEDLLTLQTTQDQLVVQQQQQQQQGHQLNTNIDSQSQDTQDNFKASSLSGVPADSNASPQVSAAGPAPKKNHEDSAGNDSSPPKVHSSSKGNENGEQQQGNTDGNNNSQLSEQLNTAHNNDNSGETQNVNTDEQSQTVQDNENTDEESTSTNLPLAESTTSTIVSNTTNDGAGIDISVLKQIFFGVFICLLSPLTVWWCVAV